MSIILPTKVDKETDTSTTPAPRDQSAQALHEFNGCVTLQAPFSRIPVCVRKNFDAKKTLRAATTPPYARFSRMTHPTPHEVNAADLEIWLREGLRERPLYARLKSLTVLSTRLEPSGWTAIIDGDFTTAERAFCAALVAELQKIARLGKK